mgnify:FL=1
MSRSQIQYARRPDFRAVLALLDLSDARVKGMTCREIADASGMTRDETVSVLMKLMDAGLARSLRPEVGPRRYFATGVHRAER